MKYAVRWLRRQQILVVPTDKSGCFALIHEVMDSRLLSRKITQEHYEHLSSLSIKPDQIASDARLLIRKLRKVAKDKEFCLGFSNSDTAVERLDEVKRVLFSSDNAALIGKVQRTYKAHKPPGLASYRVIHSTVGSPFRGISGLINDILEPLLAKQSHIVPSTATFISRLRGARFRVPVIFAKFDIENYYMSAPHDALTKAVVDFCDWPPTESSFLRALVDTVLLNQFVKSKDQHYKVLKGSGMGAGHSSSVSSSAFFSKVERTLLSAESRKAHGLLRYYRYEDDIFTVFLAQASYVKQFKSELDRLSSGMWVCTIDETHWSRISFLDVEVSSSFRAQRVSPAVMAKIRKLGAQYSKDLANVGRSKTLIAGLEEDIKCLKDGKLPAGVKALSFAYTNDCVDKPISDERGQPLNAPFKLGH